MNGQIFSWVLFFFFLRGSVEYLNFQSKYAFVDMSMSYATLPTGPGQIHVC